jgi:hypothetical protein
LNLSSIALNRLWRLFWLTSYTSPSRTPVTQRNKANRVPRPAHSAQAARCLIRSLYGPYQPLHRLIATEFPCQASLDISFSGAELQYYLHSLIHNLRTHLIGAPQLIPIWTHSGGPTTPTTPTYYHFSCITANFKIYMPHGDRVIQTCRPGWVQRARRVSRGDTSVDR